MNLVTDTLNACLMADDLRVFLAKNRQLSLRVHSVFHTSINLVAPGDVLVTLVSGKRDIMPMGMTVDLPEGAVWPVVVDDMLEYSGMPFLETASHRFQILMKNVQIWEPELRRLSWGDFNSVEKALDFLKESLMRRESCGISSLARYLDRYRADQRADVCCENVYCRFIYSDLVQFLDAIEAGDWGLASEKASMLVGFGPGLTPSCDDFMTAVLLSLYYYEKKDSKEAERIGSFMREVVSVAKRQTTLVSASMIGHAADGKASDAYLSVLGACVSGDAEALERETERVFGFGASSGADFLFGLFAIQRILERQRPRRTERPPSVEWRTEWKRF